MLKHKFKFADLVNLAEEKQENLIAMITKLQGVTACKHGDCQLLNRLIAAKTVAMRIGYTL